MCYTHCMNHLIIQLQLMVVLLPSKFKPVFSLCLAGCNIPRQQKELFYFLCLFFSRLYHSVHWEQSVFVFYYSSCSCVHCGMSITHDFRPVFFLLGVNVNCILMAELTFPCMTDFYWFVVLSEVDDFYGCRLSNQ